MNVFPCVSQIVRYAFVYILHSLRDSKRSKTQYIIYITGNKISLGTSSYTVYHVYNECNRIILCIAF